MKRVLLIQIIVYTTAIVNAQAPLNWTSPMVVNSSIGTDWPRVAVSNSNPIVVWGDFNYGTIFYRRLVSGNFGPEVQLSPNNLSAAISTLTGPDMKASGDTVYVTYVDIGGNHAWLHRSFDGGLTFSDTIRIDNIGDNYLQYSTVDILPGGNPIISFAKLNSSFGDPQYVVTKSSNAGSTFSADEDVTSSLGADPCDCCPRSIVYHEGVSAIIYRNSINNLRDMRAAISHDGGNTFDELGNIDNSNWILMSCPSSGGQGTIKGDSLISVFMNGVTGNKCFVTTLNLNTLQPGFQKELYNLPGGGSQNHPRMVARGDTIAAVWGQIIGGSRNIMFSYSLTGPSGLGEVVDTISDVLPGGHHSNPDIAYLNGTFYVVFGDEVEEKIYLMEGVLFGTIGIQNTSSALPSIEVAGNLQGDAINILSSQILNEECSVSVYDMNGRAQERLKLGRLENSQSLKFDHRLPGGIYLISISSDDFFVSGKFVITH